MARLQDRLARLTQQNFVGRDEEITLFQVAIKSESLDFCLLYVYGAGGMGKTTLTRRLMQVCDLENVPHFLLDARRIEASPESFLHHWNLVVTGEEKVRRVVFMDTYEQIAPLDSWLRDVFLPELPEETFLVFAGRTPPAVEWRTHPGWRELCHIVPLENLTPDECEKYLSARNVPAERHPSALKFTHGHPLALALAADILAQRADLDLSDNPPPDILQALLERFANEVPSEKHREALEAAALTRVVTEEYLDAVVGKNDAPALFRWLQTLSFLESSEEGMQVHDSVREVLMAELRWRNRDRYLHLHQRARDYYFERYHQHAEFQTNETLFDYIYLHRHIAAVRPFFDWYAHNDLLADNYRDTDRRPLLEMVYRHEGEASLRAAAHWLAKQPESVTVFRAPNQGTLNAQHSTPNALPGFMMALNLSGLTEADCGEDKVTAEVVRFLRTQHPLNEGERATFFRLWMADETYQEVSPVQNQVFIHAVRHYLTTPGLVYSVFPFAKPEFWSLVMHYGDIPRVDTLDFLVKERVYGCFAHDWRETPPAAWLALVTERQQWLDARLEETDEETVSSSPAPVSLNREEFLEALRLALKTFTSPDRLLHNPLLRSRMILEAAGVTADAEKRVRTLRDLILSTVAPLQNSPKDKRLYTALELAYFKPAPSQEKAADIQDVSYATYRRYLSAGIERLSEAMWARENGEWRKMSAN